MGGWTAVAHAGISAALIAIAAALGACGGGAHYKTFRVPSGAMLPTIKIGQDIEADTSAYASDDPKRGDIVVFHPPRGAESAGEKCGLARSSNEPCPTSTSDRSDLTFVKRVVAVSGDRVKVLNNEVYVNGTRQEDSFANLTPCTDLCNLPKEITVPSGQFFVMGDNRGESDDSRDWGPVQKGWIVGRVKQ